MLNFETDGWVVEVDRMVHLSNPHATNYSEIEKATTKLVKHYHRYQHEFITTSSDSDETVRELQTTATEGDLVIVGGGEATVNIAAKAATTGLRGEIIPHLILPGGNKNDLANSLHVNVLKNLIGTIDSARDLATIYPLETHIDFVDAKEPRDEVAVSYLDIGALSEIASLENELRTGKIAKIARSYEFTRWIHDAVIAIQGLAIASTFKLQDNKLKDSKPFQLIDYGYINGSRLAGFIETRVTSSELKSVRVEQPRMLDLIVEGLELAISSSGGQIVENIDDDFTLKSHTHTKMHYDGEVIALTPGDRIKIKRSSRPFYVLKNKRDRKKFQD